jgi:hypothetical protein
MASIAFDGGSKIFVRRPQNLAIFLLTEIMSQAPPKWLTDEYRSGGAPVVA